MEKRVKAVFVFFVTNKRQFQCLDLYVKGYCTFSQSLMVLNGRNCMYQIWKGATEIILRQRVEKFNEKVCPVLEFLLIIMLFTKQKPWWRSWFLAENAPFFGIWHRYIGCLGHLHAAKSSLTPQKEEKTKQYSYDNFGGQLENQLLRSYITGTQFLRPKNLSNLR